MLKPCLSKQARQQLIKLSRSNPRLLDDVLAGIAKLAHEPFEGLHRPKPLVGTLKGFWSIRINQKDRLVYQVEGNRLLIASIEGHYDDH
jgi:Txe/YoeB family toxin of toxin-antitoxin system